MNEDFLLFDKDIELASDSDAESNEIDYQEIENSFYSAIKRYELEKEVKESLKGSVNVSDSDLVEFSSDTDANMYTVTVADAPTTCAQQQTALLLEIRNINLIFLLSYFSILIYSKIKTTMINFTR